MTETCISINAMLFVINFRKVEEITFFLISKTGLIKGAEGMPTFRKPITNQKRNSNNRTTKTNYKKHEIGLTRQSSHKQEFPQRLEAKNHSHKINLIIPKTSFLLKIFPLKTMTFLQDHII